jgi:hypothetical protein
MLQRMSKPRRQRLWTMWRNTLALRMLTVGDACAMVVHLKVRLVRMMASAGNSIFPSYTPSVPLTGTIVLLCAA